MDNKIKKITLEEGLTSFLQGNILVYCGVKEGSYFKTPILLIVKDDKVYRGSYVTPDKWSFYMDLKKYLIQWNIQPQYGYFVESVEQKIEKLAVELSELNTSLRFELVGNHAVDIIRDDFLAMVSFSSGIEIHCNHDIQYESLIFILNIPLVKKLLSDLQELYTKNNGSFRTIEMDNKV